MLKTLFGASSFVVLGAASVAFSIDKPQSGQHFMSTVQIVVHEPSLPLNLRSQKIVRRQFASVFDSFPELDGKTYEVKNAGNELVFTLVTDEDVRTPMQKAVADMIQQLNGRVRAKGRSSFFRTALAAESNGVLEVVLDDTRKKIQSIAAQSVPLRDLLKELRFQLGSLSYLVPGECADKVVDWSYGEEWSDTAKKPREVHAVMEDLGALFGLKVENRNGTYLFLGTCSAELKQTRMQTGIRENLLRRAFLPEPADRPTQVFFPLTPLRD